MEDEEKNEHIRIIVNSVCIWIKTMFPSSSNKGQKVFTDANKRKVAYIESCDDFTLHKLGIVYGTYKGGKDGRVRWRRARASDQKVDKKQDVNKANGKVKNKKLWVPDVRIKNHRSGNLINRANEYRCGNCGVMSAVAYELLKDKNLANVEEIFIAKYHAIVAINRKENSDLQNMKNWGNDCWICDPWADIVCKAEDYGRSWAEKMKLWQQEGRVIADTYRNAWVDPWEWIHLIFREPKHVARSMLAERRVRLDRALALEEDDELSQVSTGDEEQEIDPEKAEDITRRQD